MRKNSKIIKANLILLGMVLFSFCFSSVFAASEVLKFKNSEQEQRYKKLTHKIRCITCANQSVADSDATIAGSLRSIVYQQIRQGKTDEQIMQFLMARYGDYVSYEPPFKLSTLFLYLGPPLFILFGLLVLFKTIKRRSLESADLELSQEEKARLSLLLSPKPESFKQEQ